MKAYGHAQLFRKEPSLGELQADLVMADGKFGLLFRRIVEIAGIGKFLQDGILRWKGHEHRQFTDIMNEPRDEEFAGSEMKVAPDNFCGQAASECVFPKKIDGVSVFLVEFGKGREDGFTDHNIFDLGMAQQNHRSFDGADRSGYPKKS